MALGFTDSGFVRLPVMGLVVAELVDFVLGCGFCVVGLGGLQDGSWWVSVEGFGSLWVGVGFEVFLGGFVGWLTVVVDGVWSIWWLSWAICSQRFYSNVFVWVWFYLWREGSRC